MLSSQEAFKLGFLSNCVEKGLSIEQMRAEVKKASDELSSIEKKAFVDGFLAPERGAFWDDFGDLLKDVGRIGMGGLILGPPAVGAGAGILHSRLSDVDEEEVEDRAERDPASELHGAQQEVAGAVLSGGGIEGYLDGRRSKSECDALEY